MTAPTQPSPTHTTHLDDLPRLPRVYVPRPRLWERLDRTAEALKAYAVAEVDPGPKVTSIRARSERTA